MQQRFSVERRLGHRVQWTVSVCRKATFVSTVSLLIFATSAANSQTSPGPASDWRRIGGTTLDLGLPSPASGPVERVWFSPDGSTVGARTRDGQVWRTTDLEKWTRAADAPPSATPALVATPESSIRSVTAPLQTSRAYSVGVHAWRSDDGGVTWTNLTSFEGRSILGGALSDIAVSPTNPDELVVAGVSGIWRSTDGGASWAGLNDNLPNLPVDRIIAVPDGGTAARIRTPEGLEAIWASGQQGGWRVAADPSPSREEEWKRTASSALPEVSVTAAARAGETLYSGFANGKIFVSPDRGRTWRPSPPVAGAGRIVRLFADGRDDRFAIAITGSLDAARVLRTVNAGVFWDDITADLPRGGVHGATADRLTGAVYVATDTGVFQTYTDPLAASPSTPWVRLRAEPAVDVMLDSAGNQLYAAFRSEGLHGVMAPHRTRDPRVVSAGDRVLRAAAPGSVLSVIGARVQSARAGQASAIVLAADDTESQVQLPYDLAGNSVVVSLNSTGGRIQVGLPVAPASPSIFVDREGNPLITSADSGLMLDAGTPATSNARIQVLATGLGKVTPSWPAGLAGPLQDPPRVIAPIRAWLDREPLQVLRATLAPGYAGVYLIELQLPSIVNRGAAELYISASGGAGDLDSNRVRIWLEP